jgi:hypothetical protein
MSVLLHIVDDSRWRRALRNVATVLAPGGHLVVIDPVVVHGWWGHSSVRRPIVVHDISGSRTRRWLCWLGTCGHRPWDCAPRREAGAAPIRSRRLIPLDERKNPLVAVWAADRARVTLPSSATGRCDRPPARRGRQRARARPARRRALPARRRGRLRLDLVPRGPEPIPPRGDGRRSHPDRDRPLGERRGGRRGRACVRRPGTRRA